MKYRTCDLDEFIKRIRGKNLVCFGTGRWSEKLSVEYPACGIEKRIKYFVDNDSTLWGSEKDILATSIKIFSPRYLYDNVDKDTVVLITCGAYNEICAQLEKQPSLKHTECYSALNIYQLQSEKVAPYTTTEQRIHKVISKVKDSGGKLIREPLNNLYNKLICYSLLDEQNLLGEFNGISGLEVWGDREHFKYVLNFIRKRKLKLTVSFGTDTKSIRQGIKYLLTSDDYLEKEAILQNNKINPKQYLILPFFDIENTLK